MSPGKEGHVADLCHTFMESSQKLWVPVKMEMGWSYSCLWLRALLGEMSRGGGDGWGSAQLLGLNLSLAVIARI